MYAAAFNANIGAWNTASVSNMNYVRAAFPARAARHRRWDALGAARAVVRGGAADALSRVRVRRRVGARMRGCPRA
jgi:hypothetical protein